MLIIFLSLVTIAAILLGRAMLGRWFNHLSIYSAIWGSVLLLVESRLIYYNAISGMAWLYIGSAWACLYLGSATVLLLHTATRQRSVSDYSELVPRLRNVIVFFSLIAVVGVITQIQAVVREFGSLWLGVFAQGNALYHARVDNPELGLAGTSYVGTFAPGACTLAGIYTARVGRITIAGLIPLVLVVVTGLLAMGRANIILAIIWFTAAFLYTPRHKFKLRRWQATTAIALAVLLLIGGIGLISGTRGLAVNYYSISPTAERASAYFPLLPPLLFYYTGPVVGFSDYLDHQNKNSHAFWGMYTFAPIFRAISHFGIHTAVPFYEENYYTPTDINVLTYLKNLHSDFGPAGVLVFPWILGALMTWLKLQLDEKESFTYIVVLTHCYLIICFSSIYNPMFLGIWYSSLFLGLAACWWIGRSWKSFRSLSTPQVGVA